MPIQIFEPKLGWPYVPLFPGHVLFLGLQKCVWPGFPNCPKCPGFSCFLNPAEFLTIAACSHNMFRSRDFHVHSFKLSNIVYNFGASGSRSQYSEYLNLFWMSVQAVNFHFDFAITRTLCKGSTFYKIRYMSMSSGSVEQQILQNKPVSHRSLFSICDQIWLLQLLLNAGLSNLPFFTELGYF